MVEINGEMTIIERQNDPPITNALHCKPHQKGIMYILKYTLKSTTCFLGTFCEVKSLSSSWFL